MIPIILMCELSVVFNMYASVGVGYQYFDCDKVFWETQSATMSGYDITSSEIGGWNLHLHHTYNFQEGGSKLHCCTLIHFDYVSFAVIDFI